MSLLSPEYAEALAQLVVGLQSTDNIARKAAEDQLNTQWKLHRPDVLLIGLAEQLNTSEDSGVSVPVLEEHARAVYRHSRKHKLTIFAQ